LSIPHVSLPDSEYSMGLMISIFGGMLLAALVYGLGRRFGLSNFWSAVAGAGIPTVLYLAYAVVTAPGLDTITMHVIAYPTVAVMLYLLYGNRRPQESRGHWVPRFMIVFFIGMTVLYGGFVYIARQGLPPEVAAWLLPNATEGRVHTGFAGVVGHGEDAAKSIAHHRNMEAKLARLGWRVEVVGLDSLRVSHTNPVHVLIKDGHRPPVSGVVARLTLARPGQAIEESVELVPHGEEGYLAMVGLPEDGEWLAQLILQSRGERVELQRMVGRE